MPDVTDHLGTVFTNVAIQLIFWGKAWIQEPTPSKDAIVGATSSLVSGPYLMGLTEYRNIGPGTLYGATVFTDSDPLDGFVLSDIENMLTRLIEASIVPSPIDVDQLLYCVIMPVGLKTGATIPDGEIGGQHSSYTGAGKNITVRYAWVRNNGKLDDVTEILSHELAEACTDADGNAFFTSDGQEIGDLCTYADGRVNGVYVQQYWSQQAQSCVLSALPVLRVAAHGAPAALNVNAQQHIFYRGGDRDTIYHVFWDPSDGFQGEQWTGPGGLTRAPAYADSDPVLLVTNDQQHLFYRGGSDQNAIYHVRWDPARGYHYETWVGRGGLTQAPHAYPAGMLAVMDFNSQQHLFYRGADNNIYQVRWDEKDGFQWEQWTGLGGRTSAPSAAGSPVVMVSTINSVSRTYRQQHLFYRDADNNINHVRWDSQSGFLWERWTGPGGCTSAPSAASNPTTMVSSVLNSSDQQHIFYMGSDGYIYHIRWDEKDGFQWEQWTGPGGHTPAPAAMSSPATMLVGLNAQQHVFYRGAADNNIYHVFWDPNSGFQWEQWTGSGGLTAAPPAASNPATLLLGAGGGSQQHIFYQGTDQSISHVLWSPDLGFQWEQWSMAPR